MLFLCTIVNTFVIFKPKLMNCISQKLNLVFYSTHKFSVVTDVFSYNNIEIIKMVIILNSGDSFNPSKCLLNPFQLFTGSVFSLFNMASKLLILILQPDVCYFCNITLTIT